MSDSTETTSITDRCEYFFDQGLKFLCQRCGRCCTGDPGTVYIAPTEIAPVAAYLGLGLEAFRTRFLYPFQNSYSLQEDDQGNCLMYSAGCRIYPVRPQQCRTYPFWFDNLRSRYAWKQTEAACPGIGKGPVYSREEILTAIASFETISTERRRCTPRKIRNNTFRLNRAWPS